MTCGSLDTVEYGPSARISPRRSTRDLVRQVGHDAEIVLDHQDRPVGGNLVDQLRRAGDVFMAHAGHRFVQQHQFRFQRQGRCYLQRPLAAVGQSTAYCRGTSPV